MDPPRCNIIAVPVPFSWVLNKLVKTSLTKKSNWNFFLVETNLLYSMKTVTYVYSGMGFHQNNCYFGSHCFYCNWIFSFIQCDLVWKIQLWHQIQVQFWQNFSRPPYYLHYLEHYYQKYHINICYQFRILRNLRIDIKDRLEEYSQSIEIDIHVCTQSYYNI